MNEKKNIGEVIKYFKFFIKLNMYYDLYQREF